MKNLFIIALLTLSGSANAMLRSQSQESLLQYYEQNNNPHPSSLQRNSAPVQDHIISVGSEPRAGHNQELSACEDCLLMLEENCDQRRHCILCCSIPAFVCLLGGALGAVLLLGS